MGLLDSEEGKRRLLTIEVPLIERYNAQREPEFRIQVKRHGDGIALSYLLKPLSNVYELRTTLSRNYPTDPPLTQVLTDIMRPQCPPHLLSEQTLCLWRQGSSKYTSRWDPAKFTAVFAVQAAWRWLACYEVWRSCGEWPLPDAA